MKVASNTVKINKVNANAVSVRNSNSALDYSHPDELKFANAPNYPKEILAQSQKPTYGHSQRIQTASGKLLVFNGTDSDVLDPSTVSQGSNNYNDYSAKGQLGGLRAHSNTARPAKGTFVLSQTTRMDGPLVAQGTTQNFKKIATFGESANRAGSQQSHHKEPFAHQSLRNKAPSVNEQAIPDHSVSNYQIPHFSMQNTSAPTIN